MHQFFDIQNDNAFNLCFLWINFCDVSEKLNLPVCYIFGSWSMYIHEVFELRFTKLKGMDVWSTGTDSKHLMLNEQEGVVQGDQNQNLQLPMAMMIFENLGIFDL